MGTQSGACFRGAQVNNKWCQLLCGWQSYTGAVPAAFRSLAFALAITRIFLPATTSYLTLPASVLVISVGIYTLLKVVMPVQWPRRALFNSAAFAADIAVCIALIIFTGGLHSPFLVYTLTPVLTAALLWEQRVTYSIAALSVVYVIGAHLGNPFFPVQPGLSELGFLAVYIIAICLTSVLPYLINANLRERLQSQYILTERQRLSHEVHDGIAQMVLALRWQIQLVRQRLLEMGVDLEEVRQLEKLADKAREDVRESLELLRSYTGNSGFLSYLKDYLERLRQAQDIDFHLDADTDALHLEGQIGLELLCICQEALTNVRKHSAAHHVYIGLQTVNNHLAVSIADDGCGFDALAYYHGRTGAAGQGLAIMRERAESVSGKFRVLSMPGRGTEVQVEVPFALHRGRLWRNR